MSVSHDTLFQPTKMRHQNSHMLCARNSQAI